MPLLRLSVTFTDKLWKRRGMIGSKYCPLLLVTKSSCLPMLLRSTSVLFGGKESKVFEAGLATLGAKGLGRGMQEEYTCSVTSPTVFSRFK